VSTPPPKKEWSLKGYGLWLLRCLGYIAFTAAASAVVIFAMLIVTSPSVIRFAQHPFDPSPLEPPAKSLSTEAIAATQDQTNIGYWVLFCVGANDAAQLRPIARALFFEAPEMREGTGLVDLEKPSLTDQDLTRGTVQNLNQTTMRIGRLTRNIVASRNGQSEKVRESYINEQIATYLTIGLGLVTTILVALSTSDIVDRDKLRGKTIRIAAVSFPAIGTAVAAVVAFYGPSANYSRANHAVLSLRQLHEQISTGVWKSGVRNCTVEMTGGQWDELGHRIDNWEQRYQEIMDASTSEGSSASEATKPSPSDPAPASVPSTSPLPSAPTAKKKMSEERRALPQDFASKAGDE